MLNPQQLQLSNLHIQRQARHAKQTASHAQPKGREHEHAGADRKHVMGNARFNTFPKCVQKRMKEPSTAQQHGHAQRVTRASGLYKNTTASIALERPQECQLSTLRKQT